MGKTYNANKILNGTVLKINSHMTPLGLYEALYKSTDKNIWMDDVENLFSNDKTVGVCKQLCETLPEKEICYLTSWNLKKTRKVPKRFKTSAKVMMTINSIQRLKSAGITALLDRGLVIDFEPSVREMENYIKESFSNFNQEILDFLSSLNQFSLRDYIKCSQLQSAGFEDWRNLYLGKPASKSSSQSQQKKRIGRPEVEYPQKIAELIFKYNDKGWSSCRIKSKIFRETGERLNPKTIIKYIKRKRGVYKFTRIDKKCKSPDSCNSQQKNKKPLKTREGRPRTKIPEKIEKQILEYYDHKLSSNAISMAIYDKHNFYINDANVRKLIAEKRGEYKWKMPKIGKLDIKRRNKKIIDSLHNKSQNSVTIRNTKQSSFSMEEALKLLQKKRNASEKPRDNIRKYKHTENQTTDDESFDSIEYQKSNTCNVCGEPCEDGITCEICKEVNQIKDMHGV